MMFRFILMQMLFLVACTKTVKVDLQVSARDSQGQVVSGASVKVDGDFVGSTDAEGHLRVPLKLSRGKRHKVEVAKSSADYYFAPFYDSFDSGSSSESLVAVEALLYAVPKPSPEEQVEIEKESAPDPAKSDQAVAEQVADTKSSPVAQVVETPVATSSSASQPGAVEVGGESEVTISATEAPIIYTIHVFEGERPLKGAQIVFAHDDQRLFESGCRSNERGRCVIRFSAAPPSSVKLVARLDGYQTQAATVTITHQGLHRFSLQRGASIEVLAQTRNYNRITPIADIGVAISGKATGVTDAYGHFLAPYRGKRTDLVPVTLTSAKMLPTKYETDFVVSGPVRLTKQFTPKRPIAARIAILTLQTSGDVRNKQLYQPDVGTDRDVLRSVKKFMTMRGGFQEVALSSLRRANKLTPTRLTKSLVRGWAGTKYSANLDFVVLPTLVVGEPMLLELAIIGAHGQVVAAATEAVGQLKESSAIDDAVAGISERLHETFPFQASVLEATKTDVKMNVGAVNNLGIKPGDYADIFGTQVDADGLRQIQTKIARVKVKSIGRDHSMAQIQRLEPRSTIQLGDLAVFRAAYAPSAAGVELRIYGALPNGQARSLAQANVYLGDKWVGATDAGGRLVIAPALLKSKLTMRVIKPGHRAFTKDVGPDLAGRQDITIVRESAAVDVDAGAESLDVVLDMPGNGDKRVADFAGQCSVAPLASELEQSRQRNLIQNFRHWFVSRDTLVAPLSAKSQHDAFYFIAYCQHRLWEANKDVLLLPNLVAAWRDYNEAPPYRADRQADIAHHADLRTAAHKMYSDAEAALSKVVSMRAN